MSMVAWTGDWGWLPEAISINTKAVHRAGGTDDHQVAVHGWEAVISPSAATVLSTAPVFASSMLIFPSISA